MNSHNIKLLIGASILIIYISIGVFGLVQFNHINHTTEVPMVNCPYANDGSSVCSNTFNHINNWHQFSNVIISSLFLFSSLLISLVLYSFSKNNLFNKKQQFFYKWKYYLNNKISFLYSSRIIRWLSLLENSPSFNTA